MATRDRIEHDLERLHIPPGQRGGAPGSPPRRRWWPYFGGLVALAAGTAALFVLLRPATTRVEVVRAQLSGNAAGGAALIASGYVVPHHRVQVGSKVMGKVAWVGVEKGDRVKTGQFLVRLEDDEYRAQVAQARGALAVAAARLQELEAGSRPEEIERARAERDNARANFERAQQLAAQGVYSPQQLDDARARYEVAEKTHELARLGPRKEEIEQGRAALAQAQGTLAFAEAQLEATRIRAPIKGTILERLVERGEMVTTMFAGERGAKSFVVSLADLGDIRVELDINQNDFARVAMKQACDMVLEAYPDRHYRGEVVEIAPEANRQKGTVQVKVQFRDPDEKVRPEMIARVAFQEQKRAGGSPAVVSIPRRARLEREGRSVVFVVRDSRARMVPIRASEASGDTLIVHEGLQGGETVVVRGHDGLRDGARIILEGSPSKQP